MRTLVLVFGDQLCATAAAFDGFDPRQDGVWMAEAAEEATHVLSSQPRIALFLAAMRQFARELESLGRPLHYTRLDDAGHCGALAAQLDRDIARLAPQRLVMTEPGEWRVLQIVTAAAARWAVPLEVRTDRHFYATTAEFAAYARQRKGLRLEYFYREMRRRHGILMRGSEPEGGRWNFDADNRAAFGAGGPGLVPPRSAFAPDAITAEVLALVGRRFAAHPGSLAQFSWPVTRRQALLALDAFVAERLPGFGAHQDAMWQGEAWLYHSHLSAALNLKLLDPREVVGAAVEAYRKGLAPLASVEGFVRQILGWREYVRGIYWTRMPGYRDANALQAQQELPDWYWTGDTGFACLAAVIRQTLATGYAHHIQRLMVTGLYAMLLGVQPQRVHEWYLGVYVDAVEWVELPNTVGMSQYADGGLMASKPYAATGKYIDRMSNYCGGCRFDPAQRDGATACPFTTLYWDFLLRHEGRLASNQRMALQLRNLARLSAVQRAAIVRRAEAIRRGEVGRV